MNNSKNKPKFSPVKKGDIVDVIAPARGVNKHELIRIQKFIESMGLVARIPKDIIKGDIIASAPLKVREKHMIDALYAKDSTAVWCVKGGTASPEIIPALSKLKKPNKEKLFIGFSDITMLHIFMNQKWGWKTVHGPILWALAKKRESEESIQQIKRLIFGEDYIRDFKLKKINKLARENKKEIKVKYIKGGNLKLIQCSIGTPWELNAKDSILVFEDVNEQAYQVNRILHHILQSNLTKGAKAIIFGDFEGGDIEYEEKEINEVIKRFSQEVNLPVYRTTGIGHTANNIAFFHGAPATIKNTKLTCS